MNEVENLKAINAQLHKQLKNLLECVKVYAPEYMHGAPTKQHIAQAQKALDHEYAPKKDFTPVHISDFMAGAEDE